MKVAQPNSVTRSYTQSVCRPPAEVFPLLCPVREAEWVNGWEPRLVLTESGVGETGCIFVTPGLPQDSVWIMTDVDPEALHIAILKVIPGVVVGSIEIQLRADGEDATEADISYTYTSITEYGDRMLEEFTEEHFRAFMETWENEINHFLVTGTRLELG
jgi:hypothetical protein